VKALGALGDRESLPKILELAENDPEREVRLWAIAAVGQIGDPGAFDWLVARLRHGDFDVRRAAGGGRRHSRSPASATHVLSPS
jgi:HEAT repeat protein